MRPRTKRLESDEAKNKAEDTKPDVAAPVKDRVNKLREAGYTYALYCYQKCLLETILRQKPLKPSQDGRHIPLQVGQEHALVDERRGHSYISNAIRTSRYTIWNFLPKQLFFQFTRLANFYFLAVGIPQTIPGFSTTGSYTTILPLMFFVLLTIIKEGYDDYKRHRLDKLENANAATVLRNCNADVDPTFALQSRKWFSSKVKIVESTLEPVAGESDGEYAWTQVKWRNVRVGDIVKLSRDEAVPADIVLLHATGENGLAYVDTMDLDGETSLKSKESLPEFKDCTTVAGLRACEAEFVVEDPNPDLYNFDGKVVVNGQTQPLTSKEVVYRGSTLRNTSCAIGIVINTGEECKIRMNANQHPDAKKPALETVANKIVIALALYVIILSVGCSMGYVIWRRSTERHAWYLTDATVPFKQIIIGYAIMYNNVIPLSLYVTLEITRIGQLLMLNGDLEMYDEATDTPARCNTNTILENLGQVSYVFSDKTGTLTDNVMKFRKMSIAGTSWLHQMDLETDENNTSRPPQRSGVSVPPSPRKSWEPNGSIREGIELSPMPSPASPSTSPLPPTSPRRSSSQWRSSGRPDLKQPDVTTSDLLEFIKLRPASAFARRAKDYILCMALCHTCLPEVTDGKVDFQASSPDELALVRAAHELGYLVTHRSSQSVSLRITTDDGGSRTETYQILDVVEFSSKRKRMSIVVRYPDGRICLICKGADSMVMPRLRQAQLAMQKASEVRQSVELEHEMLRRSEQLEVRNSFGGRPSLNLRRSIALNRNSTTLNPPPSPANRPSIARSKSVEAGKSKLSTDKPRPSLTTRTVSMDVVKTLAQPSLLSPRLPTNTKYGFLDDPSILDESMVFTRCFRHLDDFATEGLRTLLFARKFIPEAEYNAWKKIYNEATTSLVNRQDKIEEAGEIIEQSLDLVGATAIEDKLQVGVPETIDKLRRANIKIWMLTGDKRETAINIAHSARICRPGSDIFILDSSKSSLKNQIEDVMEDIQTGCIHSVVVIDGQTLATVEQSGHLTDLFYTLIPRIDAVICCRASPAQKSMIVKAIRQRLPKALTLAIGDGANDLAMITSSHVGVGISGKEGLQAARVADFSIAQFRFLQRLLLVHGRWNYVRTGKFILATFWKEMFFYLPTAMYQRYNGYSGTSLYESWSLTVYNTLFTSLCVLCMGIWEQDLSAQTLLAVPELYVHGQRNRELNISRFVRWMFGAAVEGVFVYLSAWAAYGVFGRPRDNGLYAFGDLVFSVGVVWINAKLFILETHHKTGIVMGGLFITVAGWWAWQGFLDGVYTPQPSPYDAQGGFSTAFGKDPIWWLTFLIAFFVLATLELSYKTAKRYLILAGQWRWPPWKPRELDDNLEEWKLELWQELEKDPIVRKRLRKANADEDEDEDEGGHGSHDEDVVYGQRSNDVDIEMAS
ncbi:P-type ATPase [Xylariomycetidae sp. FL0641]|nr:P-type ATPase [Xylariomycetidae sp. FL0641]